VEDDRDPVRGQADVELDDIGARPERRLEGTEGVLGFDRRRTAMRDDQRTFVEFATGYCHRRTGVTILTPSRPGARSAMWVS
jgi:hypothetical protein